MVVDYVYFFWVCVVVGLDFLFHEAAYCDDCV